MKRLVLLLTLPALAGAAFTNAYARTDATQTICHRTASKANPYVKLRVSGAALAAHGKHAADIIPMPKGGCPKTLLTPTSGGRAFDVVLTGETESPAGDPVGTGTATVRLRAGQGQLCYELAVSNLTAAAAAHIHKAATGVAGPVVAAILADPASYYVNVHTAEFPAGAVRGQLVGSSAASLGKTLALELKGTSEPNAKGTAVLRIRKDAGLVCYRLHAESITLPATAAHIHRGAAGVNGPVVVPFTAPAANGNASGCVTADAALIDEILANPAGFYVNVHTTEHPA